MRPPILCSASVLVISLVGPVVATSTAFAASQRECAIWLCLPGGFPLGCEAAKSAMMDRLDDGKSPLPSFTSCSIDTQGRGSRQMSYDFNYAALIEAHTLCTRWRSGGDESYCASWESIPQHMVKGARCRSDRDGNRVPAFCVRTFRYVDVFVDHQRAGDTYFW
ncbi:hypothetical protein GCM10011348_28440 [Marinobacterium nitratireducens]|uniref:TraL protein n=1 Tax=Marinobacterium nitratireducens TaxID=518897 RepID=A0A917ZKR9_9GAMM|nr:conjugal transfer protein TraL [Marinobacterium nitratireducens]GGO83799.1 hypothetical protein GCM10011348_28440 [Marinobacterium nitratireducens]